MDKEAPETSLTKSIDLDDDLHEAAFARKGCCFWIPCLNGSSHASGSGDWERIGNRAGKEVEAQEWWRKGWNAVKKVREWSEILAGPKWKTFIRRFNKGNRAGRNGKFNYDPVDYAKNFDDGGADGDEDALRRGFSLRYASVPASSKSSMDLGKDGPVFA